MSVYSFLNCSSITVTSFLYNDAVLSPSFVWFHPSKFRLITFSVRHTDRNNHITESENSSVGIESRDFNPNYTEPISNSASVIETRTAPWMKGPLLVKPNEIMGYEKPSRSKDYSDSNEDHPDMALTGKVGGGRGKVAMKHIFKGIKKLQEKQDLEEIEKKPEHVKFKFAPNDLWGDGDCGNVAEVENKSETVHETLEEFEFDIPLAEVKNEEKFTKFPWERDQVMPIKFIKKEKVATAAELSLDEELLKRLKGEAAMMEQWVKVKKAGVTQAVVDQIIDIWRTDELALLNFDLPLCRNMDRAREIVEARTGGFVVWSKKEFLAVFRGCNYVLRSKHYSKTKHKSDHDQDDSSFNKYYQNGTTVAESSLHETIHKNDGKWESVLSSSLYEREADRLLDGLGPRFVDWWMPRPLPVDADLLPEVIPGYKTPFRLCPPNTRATLTDAELTHLRKLARPLPTHFVLGRNRKLQGLATAILKLWERCHIAKIALKWGIPNTDNEQMAYELKILTGGDLLLRNKFLIILYRGKDFVPTEVASQVAARETELIKFHVEEETARLKASEAFSMTHEQLNDSGIVGTLSEFHSIQSESWNLKKGKAEVEVQLEVEQERLEKELKDQQRQHYILKKKIGKSAKILEKLNHEWRLGEQDVDREIISQEERECLRKMGLKMDSCLVLGRRGIFDGVIEGMHQHWKHREVVKVITMQKRFSQVMNTAKLLEAESAGILVSIVKLKEGHAIIVYRGKNYKRPKSLPQNMLNKSEALSRSLEMQRIGSLKFFAYQREHEICDLERKLAELQRRTESVSK